MAVVPTGRALFRRGANWRTFARRGRDAGQTAARFETVPCFWAKTDHSPDNLSQPHEALGTPSPEMHDGSQDDLTQSRRARVIFRQNLSPTNVNLRNINGLPLMARWTLDPPKPKWSSLAEGHRNIR